MSVEKRLPTARLNHRLVELIAQKDWQTQNGDKDHYMSYTLISKTSAEYSEEYIDQSVEIPCIVALSLMVIVLISIVVLLLLGVFLHKALAIMCSYTAKYVCSSYLIAASTDERLRRDLNFRPISWVRYEVDQSANTVIARCLWVRRSISMQADDDQAIYAWGEEKIDSLPLEERRSSDDQQKALQDYTTDYDAALQQHLQSYLSDYPATLAIVVASRKEATSGGCMIRGEAYAQGVDMSTRLLGWSMTKTIAAALIGIMIKQGRMDLDENDLFPAWKGDARRDITLRQLLQMNTGLRWSEDYFKISDVTRMLYAEQSVCDYAMNRKLSYEPGTHWSYSSGTTNILSRLLRQRIADDDSYRYFAQRELFDPLGMSRAILEMDRAGDIVLSSYGWATAREWTRFGELYLQDGLWAGREIISADYIRWSQEPATGSDGAYGAHIWLNTDQKAIPSVPADAYYENGFGSQRVLVIPSEGVVITVLSGMQLNFDYDGLYSGVLTHLSGGTV